MITYQKTIAGAFRDVSNALIALNKQRVYREQQEKLVEAAQDATRLARLRYEGGSTAYLEVLTTDTNLYSAQLNLATAQQGEALSLVQLYSALGAAGSNRSAIALRIYGPARAHWVYRKTQVSRRDLGHPLLRRLRRSIQ